MTNVIACIDSSTAAPAICDYAAWASLRLDAPLSFVHVLNKRQYPVTADLSGNIGLGSREQLLEELASLDAQRAKLALEQGRVMLDAAKKRALGAGVIDPTSRQRHGDLVENLQELETDMRLLVMGRQGESSDRASQHIGSQLESVIRVIHRPILVTPDGFLKPQRVMLAFDGSQTTRKGVEMLASSPLLKGLPMHLVMVGPANDELKAQLNWAKETLLNAGFAVHVEIRTGEVTAVLHSYQQEHDIDLLVMGAYGHSRIRQFFIGSITTKMLCSHTGALLLLHL